MKRVALFVAGVLVFAVFAAFTIFWLLFRIPYPPQPKFGFTGNWRSSDVFGFEEHPLPPAAEVWKDYAAWSAATNQQRSRLYLARLGAAAFQSAFRSWVSSGDTPMGAQRYTNVEFIYS